MSAYVRRLVALPAGTWILLRRHAELRGVGATTLIRMIVLEWLSGREL